MTALCLPVWWGYLRYALSSHGEVLTEHGYEDSATGSPKTILKTGFKAGIIKDEELWIRALAARNNVPHAYNREVAYDIVSQTKEQFYDMFRTLEEDIKRWI